MLPNLEELGVRIPQEHRETAIILWCGDGRLQELANALKRHIYDQAGFWPFSMSISGGAWSLVDRDRPDRQRFTEEELVTYLTVAPATLTRIYLLMHSGCGRMTAVDGCEFSGRRHELGFLMEKAQEAKRHVVRFLATDPRVEELREHRALGDIEVIPAIIDVVTGQWITTESEVSELAVIA